jgi:basic membrane protein A
VKINMRQKKKVLPVVCTMLLFLISAITLPASSTVAEVGEVQKTEQYDATIALVLSTGGLGDFGFNDLAMLGLLNANATYNLDADWVEPDTVAEINTFIEQFATSTEKTYDLIIAIGFSSMAGVNESALKHPNQKYMLLDFDLTFANLSNVASTSFLEHEGSFLVGAMAAMTTKSNTVGFLGGEIVPLIKKFQAGYEQGVRHINPNIEILVQYAPDQANPWEDVTGGKTVGNNFIDQGADVIYAAAGKTGLGMFDAVTEANDAASAGADKIYAIGVDADQDGLHPGEILCSMVKRVDTAVERNIKRIVDGLDPADFLSQGLETGLIDISNMTFTQTEKDTVYNSTTGQTRYEKVLELKQEIIDGDIVVASTIAATPGFEYAGLVSALFVIAAIPLIRRRRKP